MIENEFDWIALSFVRHAQDIIDLKKLIEAHSDFKIPIIAKIEKPEGKNIDEILLECDGLMVARGDLGSRSSNGRSSCHSEKISRQSQILL